MKDIRNMNKKIWGLLLAVMLTVQPLLPALPLQSAAQPAVALAESLPSGQEEVFEMDGSKIEGIDIHWITPDSPKGNNGAAVPEDILSSNQKLFLATKEIADLQMKFQVEVSFSGQFDYAPGDIIITIPAKVWHGRKYENDAGVVDKTTYVGGMDLSVPMAPSMAADFSWQLIDGNYVLTNTKTIGATSKAMFQFTITGLSPEKIVDMSECDPITAHCEVVTNRKNVIQRTSKPITAQIDTYAEIIASYKDGEFYESAPSELPRSLLANLPAGTSPDDYYYIRWYTNKRHKTNQPFSLKLEDRLGDAYKIVNGEEVFVSEGIMLGSSSHAGDVLNAASTPDAVPNAKNNPTADFVAEIHPNRYVESSKVHYDTTVVLWSAYLKSDFTVPTAKEPQVQYIFENDAKWIVTEADADAGTLPMSDGKHVTETTCSAREVYAPVQWTRPTGRFEVFKWTEEYPNEDWLYGYGLNLLLANKPVSMKYHLETVGFGYPWTSRRTNPDDEDYYGHEEEPTEEDFGNLGWRQITEDFQTFFNYSDVPLTSDDFETTWLQVTTPLKMKYTKATRPTYGYKPNSDGSAIVDATINAGEYGYLVDYSLPNPDMIVEYMLNEDGQWHHAATATWGSTGKGAFQFVDVAEADGVTVDTGSRKVFFPENTTDVRHIFVSNVSGGVAADKCHTAAIIWDVYLGIDLKPSDNTIAIARELFETSDNPNTKFRNDVHMFVDGWVEKNGTGVRLWPDNPNSFYDISRATIAGAGYGVSITKEVDYNPNSMDNRDDPGDNDTQHRLVRLHYSATVAEESNLKDRNEYDMAVADGIIPQETEGVWYDLLPEGVEPIMDSIRLSKGETITAKYTVPNYRGTNRTLLVVEMDMTPTITKDGYTDFWQDTFEIKFDAWISWESISDFGTNAVNYIAFESRNDSLRDGILGTIKGRQGEPDNPLGGMNTWTPGMPEKIADVLTGLNPNTKPGEYRFVYDDAEVNLNVNTSAVSGIAKLVKDDLSTAGWTQGLEGQTQVVVYEGHNYTYRLRVDSSGNTKTSDIIIYDTIENYHIPDPANEAVKDPTKESDFIDKESKKEWQGDWAGVGQWRGTLTSVDLSDFVNSGVAPVLYYSVLPDLTFADSTPDMDQAARLELFSKNEYDVANTAYWQKAEGLTAEGLWVVPENLSGQISAVAIDARTGADGKPFVLEPGKAMAGYLHMVAPDDDSNPDVWHAKGAYAHKVDADGNPLQEVDWEAAADSRNNMYAFNNTRLKCVQTGVEAGGQSSDIMIRNDYTRVGILPGVVSVEKKWDDAENWDGIQPEEITVTLTRKAVGKDVDYSVVTNEAGEPLTLTLNETNEWKGQFLQVDLVDESNRPYLFSFDEGEVEGYTSTVFQLDPGKYQIVNTHEKDTVSVSGQKQWNDNGDQAGKRPESIRVSLLQDGVVIRKLVVQPDANGNWTYDFGKLEKNKQGGEPHLYEVIEEYVPKYVPSSEDYTLLVNDYEPYGDLLITKLLAQETEISKDTQFTFTIELFEEAEDGAANGLKPLLNKYDYTIETLDEATGEWKGTTNGQLGCSSTFLLKGNQRIHIKKLPSESTYAISEASQPGFTLTGMVNETGTIRAGQTTEAEFTNTYIASGSVQLNALKSQTGHALYKNQHRFELVDLNVGETENEVIRMAYVGTPTNAQDEETGVITGNAVASFGALTFTEADHGKTFTYQVREVNAEQGGYQYDDKVVDVTVTVADNGDGTMTVTAVDAQGNDLTVFTGENLPFDNTYTAKGSVELKGWKVMPARELEADEFEFELYRCDAEGNLLDSTPFRTVKNDEDGNVIFPKIEYDENDVNLDEDIPAKYYYLAVEKAGEDNTVVYSDQAYLYEVTVYDNNDGSLSVVEGAHAATRLWEDCEACAGTGFKSVRVDAHYALNTTGTQTDGVSYLRIEKQNLERTDFCAECGGHSALNGTDCSNCHSAGFEPYGIINATYVNNCKFELTTCESIYSTVKMKELSVVLGITQGDNKQYGLCIVGDETTLCDVCNGSCRYPAGIELSAGTAIPVFENDLKPGDLKVHKVVNSNDYPQQPFTFKLKLQGENLPTTLDVEYGGVAPTVPQPEPDTGDGSTGGAGSESPVEIPFENNGIVKATIAQLDGDPYGVLDTTTGVFTFFRAKSTNMIDPEGNSFTSGDRVVNGNKIYYKLNESIENNKPAWTDEDILRITEIKMEGYYRPYNCYYYFTNLKNLVKADLSKMDTSRCTNLHGMFNWCSSMEFVNTYSFDTSNVTSMDSMFCHCHALRAVDLQNFNTQNVRILNWMFVECDGLIDLDLSMFNTPNLTQMNNMFGGSTYLKTVDLSALDTRGTTLMEFIFNICTSLETVIFGPNFTTKDATTTVQMFNGCENLQSLDLKGFIIGENTSDNNTFLNCNQLSKVELSQSTKLSPSGYNQIPVASTNAPYNGKWINVSSNRVLSSEALFTNDGNAGI